MTISRVLCAAALSLLACTATETSVLAGDLCRLSSLSTMLTSGQKITVEAKDGARESVLYRNVSQEDCIILAAPVSAPDSPARAFSSEELGRIRYEKRGRLSPLTMAISSLAGATLGAAIGAFVDPAEALPSDYVGDDEQKGPVAGAIVGGVVGLAAGTLIPLVLKRTYVVEF